MLPRITFRRTSFLFALPIVASLLLTVPALAKRSDVVIMKNGDRLTGEVKKLESGVLYIDMPYVSGAIGLDWSQVDKVESTASFQVVLSDGRRMSGTFEKKAAPEQPKADVSVRSQKEEIRVSADQVVKLESVKESFWRQLKGSIDFGYDFTSGNNQTALTSDASATYTAIRWAANASYNTSFSGQSGGSQTNLLDFQGVGERFLNKNSFLLGLSDFLHSSQQDLNLRTTLGGGYGRYWIRTNQNVLRWIAGTVYTHEDFVGHTSDENIEGLLGLQYQLFHFDRYNLQSQLLVYPGLSDYGRIRTTTKNTFTVKLVNNFHTELSFWDNFDSRPPVTSKRNELGISSSLGWTF